MLGQVKTFEYEHNIFYYFNGNEFLALDTATGIVKDANGKVIKTLTEGEKITTLKNNYYGYIPTIEKTTKAYDMIFNIESYWLASRQSAIFSQYYGYSLRHITNELIATRAVTFSIGGPAGADNYTKGVRAVVALKPDVQLIGNSTTGWSY